MRSIRTIIALAGLAAVLAGCGTTAQPDGGSTADPTGGPVTVTDSRGEVIELPAPATRVVGLEWGEIEMLVSLGVMPVGAADVEGYGVWISAAELADDVTDVGTRGEPSVDSIVALEPDLVVMEAERGSALVTQLEEYVPVLVTAGSDASDNLNRMRSDLRMIATAVGKVPEAEALLADFDAALADGRQAIADAGADGSYFAVTDGWEQGSAISVRMFAEGSLVSDVAAELGLRNAWPTEGDAAWGLEVTDVEGLTRIDAEPVEFFYNAADGRDVFAGGLAGNAIWESLPFVEQGRLHRLPDGQWPFGGPLSCQQYIDTLLSVFAS